MDDYPENELKKLCCTCLSKDRKLSQLCRINEGVNNLYLLLSYDTEAYREGFYKDTANLHICWECEAVVSKISRFRNQACAAQKHLTDIADGRINITLQTACLSNLSRYHTTTYQIITSEAQSDTADNFIDCGPATGIKIESDDDIPLSEFMSQQETADIIEHSNIPLLHTNIHLESNIHSSNNILYDPNIPSNTKLEIYSRNLHSDDIQTLRKSKKAGNRTKSKLKNGTKLKKYFTTVAVSEEELIERRVSGKKTVEYADAVNKCDSCIQVFEDRTELESHNSSLHMEAEDYIQCNICLIYLNPNVLQEHRLTHYDKHTCKLCEHIMYSTDDMVMHLNREHGIRITGKRKKDQKNTSKDTKSGSKPRRNQSTIDKNTLRGYLCSECDAFFVNKNQRWKHVQRHHREGFKCSTCGKRFAFKNNLTRHEQLHNAPPPREECPTCHKMIRIDLLKIHSRIHSVREKFECAACDKCFVSRASYEHHLKYTQAHAAGDILKYKCATCEKGYRSRGELRDHVNYQHMGKTQHKCPICGKALATRRCITRHVRRAHDGVKESARDKICQQCGKAFRDKKGLREHEAIHTGERPLACELCGATFRQSASLYTHRRRVHRVRPARSGPRYCADAPA